MAHKIIANISELTRRQIDELAEVTGITTTAQLVSMAIDRMHNEEIRLQKLSSGHVARNEENYYSYCEKQGIQPTYRGLLAWLEDGILPQNNA